MQRSVGFPTVLDFIRELRQADFRLPEDLRFGDDGRLRGTRSELETALAPWHALMASATDLELKLAVTALRSAEVRSLTPQRLAQEVAGVRQRQSQVPRSTSKRCPEGMCVGTGVVYLYVPVDGQLDQVPTCCPCGQAPVAWRAWPPTRRRLEGWLTSSELVRSVELALGRRHRMLLLLEQLKLARRLGLEISGWVWEAIEREEASRQGSQAVWEDPIEANQTGAAK